jgi:hypothetical protein
MKLEFTEEQIKILMAFLNRVQLTGQEVPAYLEILQVINKPEDKKVTEK